MNVPSFPRIPDLYLVTRTSRTLKVHLTVMRAEVWAANAACHNAELR